MPCDPEEIERLADLLARGKLGETSAIPVIDRDPDFTSNSGMATARAKLGIFAHGRVGRHAFGDEFGVRAIDPILKETVKHENYAHKAFGDVLDNVKPLLSWSEKKITGIPRELDEKLAKLLEQTDSTGKFTGPVGSASPEEIQVVQNVRKWFNKHGEELGVDPDTYINYYRPLLRERSGGILREPGGTAMDEQFRARMTSPSNVGFYQELERRGTLTNPDPTLTAAVQGFIHGGVRSTMMKPFLDRMESEVVNPWFDVRFIAREGGQKHVMVNDETGYKLWSEMKHSLLGGVTSTDIAITNSLKKVAGLFGKEVDTRSTYQISQALSSLYYGGTIGSPIGGRPSTILRQLTQLVPTYAELGAKYTAMGVKDGLNKESIERFRAQGLLSSPYEALLQQVDVAGKAGRAISQVTSAGLHLFSSMDQGLRAITAAGSEAKFKDYAARGAIDKLSMRRELKDEIIKLIASGNEEEAMARYAFENVANLQYVYGKANRPEIMKGALGNLLNMFMTFPLNSAEMFRMMGKRAMDGDPAPLARLMLTTGAIMGAGSEFLNADMWSWTMTQAAMPYSLTFPKMVKDGYVAGQSEVEHLVGSLFNTGETKYHQQARQQGWKDFARDMTGFVPGGLFFFQDMPKVVDERTFMWALAGLKPKADVLDEMARERATVQAQERRGERGLAPLRGIR